MCQIFDTVERDVHCRVSPSEELFAAMGIWIVLVFWPFALQRPSVTVLPAQLRTSWANREGSESS